MRPVLATSVDSLVRMRAMISSMMSMARKQAFDDVQTRFVASQQEARAADDHLDAVVDPGLQHALET